MNVVVRPCRTSEYAAAAAIHVDALPGEILTLLGESFLTALYRGIAADPGGFIYVAEHKGEIVGFVSGATEAGAVCRAAVRRQWRPLTTSAIVHFLKRPTLVFRALEVLWRRSRYDDANTRAQLLAIAVSARYRGQGVGQALLTSFNDEMRRRHVDFYDVMTTEGPRVQAFYVKAGFVLLEAFDVPGARAHRFGRQLNAVDGNTSRT
jgi:ribosomal protein S18 acetylase RimI-like enzyme